MSPYFGIYLYLCARNQVINNVMTAVALNNLLNYIAGLNLSQRNRQWLADKIVNLPKKGKVVKDPTLMSEEEFFARVDEARTGEVVARFSDKESMRAWLNSL